MYSRIRKKRSSGQSKAAASEHKISQNDNRPVAFPQGLIQSSALQSLQFGKKKKGRFIGDSSAIHLHLDVGLNDHLKIGGNGPRYNLCDRSGYNNDRIQTALDALLATNDQDQFIYGNVSGFTACRNWLQSKLG